MPSSGTYIGRIMIRLTFYNAVCGSMSSMSTVTMYFGLTENGYMMPGTIFRIGRSPNMAYAFGSGFSSNIGGVSHSTSIGSSFGTGDAGAYSSGVTGTSAGGAYARGVGTTNVVPALYPLGYQQSTASAVNSGFGRTPYGSAVSSAQNYGNYGSSVASAQNHMGLGYGNAMSAVENAGPARYQSAVSSAQNVRGLGYESAVSSAHNAGGDFGSAMSATQSNGGYGDFNSAVSAAENYGGYGGSTSQVIQQRAGAVRHSGASSINGPGVQAAQSHAVNNGYY